MQQSDKALGCVGCAVVVMVVIGIAVLLEGLSEANADAFVLGLL